MPKSARVLAGGSSDGRKDVLEDAEGVIPCEMLLDCIDVGVVGIAADHCSNVEYRGDF